MLFSCITIHLTFAPPTKFHFLFVFLGVFVSVYACVCEMTMNGLQAAQLTGKATTGEKETLRGQLPVYASATSRFPSKKYKNCRTGLVGKIN